MIATRSRPPPLHTIANETERKPMKETVKKNVIQTVAHGFDLMDNQMRERVVVIFGQFTNEKRLEQTIRRDIPKFVVVSWETVKYTYEMPLDEFCEKATIIDTVEI